MSKNSEEIIGGLIANLRQQADDLIKARNDADSRMQAIGRAQADRDALDARIAAINTEIVALQDRMSSVKIAPP